MSKVSGEPQQRLSYLGQVTDQELENTKTYFTIHIFLGIIYNLKSSEQVFTITIFHRYLVYFSCFQNLEVLKSSCPKNRKGVVKFIDK